MTVTYHGNGTYKGLSSDTKPTTPPTNSMFHEIDTAMWWYWDGAYWQKSRSDIVRRKIGGVSGTSTVGWGLYSGLVSIGGTLSNSFVGADGRSSQWTTTTTQDTAAGLRINVALTCRGLNPYTEIRFKIDNVVNTRFLTGYVHINIVNNSDDPLVSTNLHGIGLSKTTDNANWRIVHNAGTATNTFVDTGVEADTEIHVFKMWGDDANSRFRCQLDNGTVHLLTTNIPPQTTGLLYSTSIINAGVSEARILNIYYVYIESDK